MANSKDTRFTLMAFPQGIDAAGNLTIHILFIPRNFSPLELVNTIFGAGNVARPFADTQPSFDVVVVNNADEFPGKIAANERTETLGLNYSDQVKRIYETIKLAKNEDGKPKYFDIDEQLSSDNPAQSAEQRAPAAEDVSKSVKKYLPETYRKAFNFTSPRVKNAVTDDSYHCAMRDNNPPVPAPKYDKISWGKVYAHLLRQPLMAEKAGLLYKTVVTLQADDYKKGGWLYVNVTNGTTYGVEQSKSLAGAGDVFVKRYAARIPALKKEVNGDFTPRSLFSAILFPVVKQGESPVGIYDELYIENANYTDGFAKVVHVNQPVSGNLLAEEQDGFHPQKEMGIRMGWDDEQILIWYLRQLAKDANVNGGVDRLDAPLGVAGYHIDVKDTDVPGSPWESLTAVQSNGDMLLEDINIGRYKGELPFQVYPVKLYGVATSNYWLPMYFANWNDHSLVIPDKTASEIHLIAEGMQNVNGTLENRNVKLSDTYSPVTANVKLRYGKAYNFRVRLTDLTGGGPDETKQPNNLSRSSEATTRFKRYVAPYALEIVNKDEVLDSTDDLNFEGDTLIVKRPLIGYPSVVYTGRYSDPVSLLKASIQSQLAAALPGQTANVNIGLSDPDVTRVAIKVEVETLQMDNLASDNGKEHYITIYNTFRKFDDRNFDGELQLKFQYKDYAILNFNDLPFHPFDNAGDNATIAADHGDLILPTCRNIRLTIRGVGDSDDGYWGNVSADDALDSRYGKVTILKMRRDSVRETQLFSGIDDPQRLQGIYLQPDPVPVYNGRVTVEQILPLSEGLPNIVQRLAKQLDVNSNEMTLIGNKGERTLFWCSNLIRHTLSPDNSSITFAGKNELAHHWLVVTTLNINRDWSWDGLETLSFTIERRKSLEDNPIDPAAREAKIKSLSYQPIGSLETRRIAPFQAIQNGDDGYIHREYTRIILIDIVDPLPVAGKNPDTILTQYRITPLFKTGIIPDVESFETKDLLLPVTVNPSQVPKVTGAGIALSPYVRNEKYSATEARRRFLWLEFENGPDDPRDALFARPLAYAPDQLISNNHPSLYAIDEEPRLPVDPEYTRVIIPDSAHDHVGLKAMQKMEKSTDGHQFYLLPLPEGLHSESAELFGFYTYEFRFGHTDQLWSTGQGRFGRPFHLTGLQHPAPNLLCTVNRDEKQIRVKAPFAMAVHNGQNVTANPPRTSIWCLLYAQVKQADGMGYRNILIGEKNLVYKVVGILNNPIRHGQDAAGLKEAKRLAIQQQYLQVAQQKEAVKYSEGMWLNAEVEEILDLYGLPIDSPLSVLCVEVFGYIRNLADHVTDLETVKAKMIESVTVNLDQAVGAYLSKTLKKPIEPNIDDSLPMSDELGLYRILRTSPLTEVPFICCTE
ncbi:MAG: hypothetical protein P0Y49_05710 [Candidatus Pedobacter colombiensis]|uniref:Uncharacterized protein n=1 Tax=Candidatus Pedobacter colombiensis TaxID=3121371 RepID=A0AAJ5W9R1_9SPHI|nr:hypothetical protein [Pedobacter sp.]WEK20632.1 MAG: hypothetical protein P0Y49_05710 [Pedobacter sp.]